MVLLVMAYWIYLNGFEIVRDNLPPGEVVRHRDVVVDRILAFKGRVAVREQGEVGAAAESPAVHRDDLLGMPY